VLAISLVIYVLVRYLQFLFQDTGAAQEQQTGKISV
jgi:hypothetical protein